MFRFQLHLARKLILQQAQRKLCNLDHIPFPVRPQTCINLPGGYLPNIGSYCQICPVHSRVNGDNETHLPIHRSLEQYISSLANGFGAGHWIRGFHFGYFVNL